MKTKILIIFCLFVLVSFVGYAQHKDGLSHKNNSAIFKIVFSKSDEVPDSELVISYLDYKFNSMEKYQAKHLIEKKFTRLNQNTFLVQLDNISEFGYVNIKLSNPPKAEPANSVLMRMYLVKPGDDILVKYSGKVSHPFFPSAFSGLGSKKYEVKNKIDSARYFEPSNDILKSIEAGMKLLNQNRGSISDLEYDILKADFLAANEGTVQTINQGFLEDYKLGDNTERYLKRPSYNRELLDSAKLISYNYADYCLSKFRNDYRLTHNWEGTDTAMYRNIIKSIDYLPFREKLITSMILHWGTQLKRGPEIIEDALIKVKDPENISRIQTIKNAILSRKIGTKAFDFQLQNVNGKIVKLSDFKGKTVFIDFWYTGCLNCVIYYKQELNKIEKHFKDNPKVVFITVSIDKRKDQWIKSINSREYTSPELINLYTGGSGDDSPVIKNYGIRSYPQPLVVDKNGNIGSLDTRILRKYETAVTLIDKIIMQK